MSDMNNQAGAGLGDYLKVLPQYLLPQSMLSMLMHSFMQIRFPPLKDFQIRFAVNHYRVNMDEAANPDPLSHSHFNGFFTRALKPDARPVAAGKELIASPSDGAISALGEIDDTTLLQAKGRDFSLVDLLGGDEKRAAGFHNGSFATIYLSPQDYHRVHMPLDGRLREMVYIPGRLFSVNAATTRLVPQLFARNERVVSLFDTEAGPMAVILVGAIFVGSIETVWAGRITPPYGSRIRCRDYTGEEKAVELAKGEEMGRFNMGSTVILLFPPDVMEWEREMAPARPVKMGELLGRLR